MEKFVRKSDYLTQIRSEILDLIIENDDDILIAAENSAIAELISYLSGRYDTTKLFAVIHDWSFAGTYKKDDRVELSPTIVWNAIDTFADGTYIANATSSKVYRVKNSPVAGTVITDASKFDEIAEFGALFFAVADVATNTKQIDDVTAWKKGDTRDPLALRYLIDVILYEIHCRINPRNIPEHRLNRRDDAIRWLKSVADPRNNVNPNFPEQVFDDQKGTDVSWGGNAKKDHYY